MKIDRFSKSSHLAQSLTPICFTGQLVRRLVEKAAKALGFQNSTMLNQNFTLEILFCKSPLLGAWFNIFRAYYARQKQCSLKNVLHRIPYLRYSMRTLSRNNNKRR